MLASHPSLLTVISYVSKLSGYNDQEMQPSETANVRLR
jgi:hypothetical protein